MRWRAGEFHRLHPEPAKYEAFANALVALGIQVTAELQTALMYGPEHAAAALRAVEALQ